MERQAFLDKLEIVQPALSAHRLLPVMTHLWFTGDTLLAYNDVISISTPLKTEFIGAVPGDTLISLMKALRAKSLEFKEEEDVLHVKASSSRLKLALLPKDQFIFEMPKPSGKEHQLNVDMVKFIELIELCLGSAGNDSTKPDQLGVTLQQIGDDLYLFATDDSTIASAHLSCKGKVPFKERAILPVAFCEQMIRLCRGHKSPTLEIHGGENYALIVAGSNQLFGRLVEPEHPIKFQGMIKHHFPDSAKDQVVNIPSKLQLILDRAVVITDAAVERNYSTISVTDGVMKFFSKSERGQISDTVQVDGHPEMKVNIEPKLLKAAWGKFEKMLMTDDCAIFTRNDAMYLVASRPS